MRALALVSCLALLSAFVAPSAVAQGRGLEVEYAVKVADIPGRYQLERATRKIPFLGVNLDTLGRVTGFPPGFDAARSRLQQDDFIVRVDGQTLEGQPAGTIFRLLNEKLGQNIRLRIRRGGEERELDMTVKFVELANYWIVESQSPTAEQLKIRESWLKR